jgi:sulfatase modifying factor 1
MHGNVWQWCEDLYDPKASDRVIRGGGWYYNGPCCRASFRGRSAPANRDDPIGFRLARVPVRQ